MPIKPIVATINELFEDIPETSLVADVAAGVGTLEVESIRDFAINKILFIGELGAETSEIIKTHTATAPSGSTVTLLSNTVFAHSQGEKVYVIDYDQIEFSHAVTTTGTKTVISIDDIDPDSVDTVIKDETYTSGYYFIRFKNSITGTFSDYSDPIPYDGYADNTVGKAIAYALKRNKTEYTDSVDHDFMIEEANLCLQYTRGKLKKWHSLQSFNYEAGQTSRGSNKVALPSDAWQYSNKSILGIRVGSGKNLTYYDKTEFEEELEGIEQSTLNAAALIGATSVTLENSNDFESSGTIMIAGQEITYTANNKTTGVLSGIPASGTGSITANLAGTEDVWQGADEGEPDKFTIYGGYAHFLPLPDAGNSGKNIFLDYWLEAPSVDSDTDVLTQSRYEMLKYWLVWAVRCQIKEDGKRSFEDGDFKLFQATLNDAISIELKSHGQKYKSRPGINMIQR